MVSSGGRVINRLVLDSDLDETPDVEIIHKIGLLS